MQHGVGASACSRPEQMLRDARSAEQARVEGGSGTGEGRETTTTIFGVPDMLTCLSGLRCSFFHAHLLFFALIFPRPFTPSAHVYTN